MRLTHLLLCSVLILLLTRCSHSGDAYNPTTENSATGTIYLTGDASIAALDIAANTFKFKTPVYDGTAYGASFLGYDSGYLYKGSQYHMTSYNTTNGNWLWNYNYYQGTVSGGYSNPSQKMIFVDSLMYFVQNFFGWGTSAYCMNKKTGRLLWRQLLAGDFGILGSSTPAISGDRVIASGGNMDGDEFINCFNRFNGQLLWKYSTPRSSSDKLEIYNGTVISYGGNKITCLNLNDGTFRWQVMPTRTAGATAVDYISVNDQMVVLRSVNNSIEGYSVNKNNSTITYRPVFPESYTQCVYTNNKLYLLINGSTDIKVKAVSIDNYSPVWTCTISPPYGDRFIAYYFTKMVLTDDRIIFGENFENTVSSRKCKFNLVDLATGSLKQQTIPVNVNPYITVVKQGKIYTAGN